MKEFVTILTVAVLRNPVEAAPDPSWTPNWSARQTTEIERLKKEHAWLKHYSEEKDNPHAELTQRLIQRVEQGDFPLAIMRVSPPGTSTTDFHLKTVLPGGSCLHSLVTVTQEVPTPDEIRTAMVKTIETMPSGKGFEEWSRTLSQLSHEELAWLIEGTGRPVDAAGFGMQLTAHKDPEGVRVTHLTPGGAAAALSLQVGDVLTHVEGKPVATPQAFSTACQGYEPGSRLAVQVIALPSKQERRVHLSIPHAAVHQAVSAFVRKGGLESLKKQLSSINEDTKRSRELYRVRLAALDRELRAIEAMDPQEFGRTHQPEFFKASDTYHGGVRPFGNSISFALPPGSRMHAMAHVETQYDTLQKRLTRGATILKKGQVTMGFGAAERGAPSEERVEPPVDEEELQGLQEISVLLRTLTDEEYARLLKEGGQPSPAGLSPAWLGASVSSLSGAERNTLKCSGGVKVRTIEPDSPAAKAGLKAEDVLLSLERTALDTPEALRLAVEGLAPGSKIQCELQRGGAPLTLWATLEARQEK